MILAAVLLAVVLGTVGVAYIWWRANGEELVEAGRQATEEGREFGATSDNPGCVAAAFERLADCDGFLCELPVRFFLSGCLVSSEATPSFCTGVPSQREILGTVRWRAVVCAAAQRPSGGSCGRVLGSVQDFCFPDS
ncbi:MAG: hypothetical protein AMS18_12970 [Gemmatimonas sp. SG8_17]|nr:MAG: hypothetical protein AMS18_12970 [Gemmatimonas sp. SG8_17]